MAAMKQEKTVWMKTEEADVVPNEPGPMVQPYPPSVYVKEEMEDGGYEEFSEDPLRTEEAHLHMKQEPQLKLDVDGSQCNVQPYPPSVYVKEEMEDGGYEEFSEDPLRTEEANLHMKQEPQLKLERDGSQCNFLGDPLGGYWSTDHLNGDSRVNFGWDENENNNAVPNTLLHTILEAESECCPPPLLVPNKELFPDDTLGISWLSDFIKEDPELILEADETENIVVASTSYASNMMRLTRNMEESCDISYEETVNQGVVNCKQEIDSEDSTSFAMFFEEQEQKIEEGVEQESLFGTRLKCSLTEYISHTFSCSICLHSFPSKYKLIMLVFVHIDGVHPPRFICKLCGDVFPSHARLNKHLKMSEVCQALSADNSEKFYFSGDQTCTFLEADRQEYVIEQTESQCSSKLSWETSYVQFNDTSNTYTVIHNAEMTDRHDNDLTSNTTGNLNAHTVLLPEKRRLKCVVSGESFTEIGSLKRNAIMHTEARRHKCDICGKSFTLLSVLKTHALIHTGNRPYKCDVCGKSFIRLGHLNRHVLIHTKIDPTNVRFVANLLLCWLISRGTN